MTKVSAAQLSFGFGRRLPVIRQDEVAECGLASLAMVASYHGIRTDLRAMRRRFTITSRGWTLLSLAENAGKLGFATRALRCGLKNVGQLRLPAILHWDLNHFVVLKSVSRNKLVIHDPARGAVSMSFDEFAEHFTGVALELIPTTDLRPKDERTRLQFSSLWSEMTGLGGTLVQVILFSLIMQVFVLASPQYLQIVVDSVLPALDTDLLLLLAIGFALLLIMNIVASVLRELVILFAGTTLAFQIASNLFHRLMRLPLVYFESRHMGDILSRFESIQPIKDFLVKGLVRSLIDGLMALITLALMFIYRPLLAAIVLGATLLYLALRLGLLRRMRSQTEQVIITGAAENSNFIETLRGIQPIKAFADESNRELR
jgi:ATP-binding cassette, subfamily B, bacterial CvaB/MchF/RaxB